MPINEDVYIGSTLNFDARVKGRRNELGMTQSDLSHLIGVSKTTIQSYESGNIPKGLNLFRLSRALKCSIDYLLLGEESPYIQQQWIVEEPFGMSQEELVKYQKEIKGTWLEQFVFSEYRDNESCQENHSEDQSSSKVPSEVSQFLKMTNEIITSNTAYAHSLMANIRSFYQAMKAENRLRNIESRLALLEEEKSIARPDHK